MIPSNYNHLSAERLSSITLSSIVEPERIDLLWLRAYSFEKKYRKFSYQEHRHSFFELHFIFAGSATYEVLGKEYRVGAAEALLIPDQLPHRAVSFSEDLVKINIAFSAENSSFSYISHARAFHFFINQFMMADFERILYEAEHQGAYCLSVIKSSVFSILSLILRGAKLVARSGGKLPESTACKIAVRYIDDNKNIFLTCRDVAIYCRMNEKYLSRLFKKEMGLTLLEYIHSVKTDEAKRLLSESDASLSEVAEMLGFSNEYYFNSFFKRRTGISPGAYREK